MDRSIDGFTEIHGGVGANGDGELGHKQAMTKSVLSGDLPGVNPTVALISPNEASMGTIRRAMEAHRATVVGEFKKYPAYANLDALLELECDAIVVEIDTDIEIALDVVETLCARKPAATTMVYSHGANSDTMVRSMRAGAREYLTGAIPKNLLEEALLRASARRLEQMAKKTSGKSMVFWGTKGGSGVTTLASNFAVALRMETAAEVALLDLNPGLGEIAVLLGITPPRFTVTDALESGRRLDQHLISTLVSQHQSGVTVLAAPDAYSLAVPAEGRTIGRLLDVAKSAYPYVVIDAGPDLGPGAETLLQMADTIYLVTQSDLMSLRNTQRFICYIKGFAEPQLELVLNRFDPRKDDFDDERVTKVLGLSPKWKVPNDYAAAHHSSNEGSPLVYGKSAAAMAIRVMARAASGKQAAPPQRRKFNLFGK
jgi:pilus assembly protein CpaE